MNDEYYGIFQASSEEELGFMILLITYLSALYFGPDLISLSFDVYEVPVD
jgi:hypothetical protein